MVELVVHCEREAYDLYVGRGSDWGNPFKIGRDGDRREVLEKYKGYLLRGEGRHLLARIGELEGLTLGCYCAPVGGLTADDKTSTTVVDHLVMHRAVCSGSAWLVPDAGDATATIRVHLRLSEPSPRPASTVAGAPRVPSAVT